MADAPDIVLGEGWDKIPNLEQADTLFLPLATQATANALEAVKEKSQVIPPQPARDRAKTFNTYVRGMGRYPKSSFVAAPAEPGGYRIRRTKKAMIKMTSQQMDKKFRMRVYLEGSSITGQLLNTATYSGYVIGSKDADAIPHQVPWHAETGWVAKEDAITQARPQIDQSFSRAIEQFIQVLAGKG